MLSIASLNIHQFLHREETLRAINDADADILCLQEVTKSAIPVLEEALGAQGYFVSMGSFEEIGEEVGIALFVRRGMLSQWGTEKYFTTERVGTPSLADCDRILQHGVIEKDGGVYRIGHTHFVWTPKGEPNERQFTAMRQLLRFTDSFEDMILCGDFNAPRGKVVWEMLAQKFTDNIPVGETTTLDQVLHRAAPLHYVVDGMFTKGRYSAHDVRVISGASDHKLITAFIEA